MNLSWRIEERDTPCDVQASLQLWRIPRAAGEPELCSCTRSRTRLSTVARTSLLGLRDDGTGAVDEEKENQLFLAFTLDTDDTEDELADLPCKFGGVEFAGGGRNDRGA